jgi:hypothetical protein
MDPACNREAQRSSRPLSQVLIEMACQEARDRISVADLLVVLSDRALAALILIFALPNVLPAPPGTSAVLGAPLLFLTAQLATGRGPWLPKVIADRSMPRSHFHAVVARAVPWLRRAERLMRPRWSTLAQPPAEYAVGGVCVLLALILFLPIPLGNIPPALAICLFSLGILERDGVWIAAGLVGAAGSVALVSGVLYAFAQSALFLLSSIGG